LRADFFDFIPSFSNLLTNQVFSSGQKLGNYTLVNPLGRGSFGEVWLATRETKFLTTKVAIKLPLREQVNIESIKQEAVLWEQASGHPNVLPIIEADEFDGQVMIVSEYASGGTLEELLKKEGVLSPRKTLDMALGIAQGLEFLHSRHVIHRDIKPANILLQGETPRLTDFGLSRAVSGNSLSMSISINGTPYYMSPEAFNRKRNKQTDIWSFGVVLYKMLAGKLPFEGDDIGELYTAVFTKEPPPLPDTIPLSLSQIVFKALEKSPAKRYTDASEMRQDLLFCLPSFSAENIQIAHSPVESIQKAQSNESAAYSTNDSITEQTFQTKRLRNTKDEFKFTQNNSLPLPKYRKKFFNYKYLAIALVLLSAISATGFYLINSRQPIPFRKGDKFGYSSWSKVIVIGAKYDLAEPFSGQLGLVALGKKDENGKFVGKYGFIDGRGREIIPLEYDLADSFSGTRAKVGKIEASTGKMLFGFIDQNGAAIIPLEFEDARDFSNELAAVKSNGKWGFINLSGTIVVPFKYDSAGDFSKYLGAVKLNGKYGFIDSSGHEIIPFAYDAAGKFSDGFAPVEKDGKAFFINDKGVVANRFKYNRANEFSENLAMVTLNGKAGFVEKDGTERITFLYEDDQTTFSEGLADVRLNGKNGFINRGGGTAIPFKYSDTAPFKNNLARVKTDDGKEFYVGYDGTEFYEP
jgi:serine/threonine protein kinase